MISSRHSLHTSRAAGITSRDTLARHSREISSGRPGIIVSTMGNRLGD